jgi:CheY-like chemotaxis protein
MRSRVLIVDDKPANLLVLRALLELKYDLIPADSGERALALLEASPFDLVLLDVEMPGLDGYETTRAIKQMPGRESTPVILISGVFTEDPYVRKGYEAGAVDYFTKPFDARMLRVKVGLYTAMRRQDAELMEKDLRIRALEAQLAARPASRT